MKSENNRNFETGLITSELKLIEQLINLLIRYGWAHGARTVAERIIVKILLFNRSV